MTINTCTLCMGSNFERKIHLNAARKALKEQFPEICFGKEIETEAIGEIYLSPFSNQIAKFETTLSPDEIRSILKDIERQNGRSPEEKAHGIVKLDIDLLTFNNLVLKPEDLRREYIQKELGSHFE